MYMKSNIITFELFEKKYFEPCHATILRDLQTQGHADNVTFPILSCICPTS